MIHFPFYPGDYGRDTVDLSDAEDLAYRRMLDHYYAHERPLPPDVSRVCRIARADTPAKKKACKHVLASFFVSTEDGFVNARADAEIERYKGLRKKRETAAKSRWNKGKPDASTDANAHTSADASADANAYPDADAPDMQNRSKWNANQNQNQKDTVETVSRAAKAAPRARAPSLDFDALWAEYPKRSGANPKAKAARAASARIKSGWKFEDLLAGTIRYREWCDASGKSDTEYVMQAVRFYGPDDLFNDEWAVKTETKSHNQRLLERLTKEGAFDD